MLINLTPHAIVLRDPLGADYTVPVSGPAARVSTTAGVPEYHPVSPVPVYSPSERGPIEGLPETVADDDLIIVSLFVVQAVQAELAAISEYATDDSRERVLERCVAPGTGPQDGAIRWTAEDAPSPAQVGQIRAVTRLVRG